MEGVSSSKPNSKGHRGAGKKMNAWRACADCFATLLCSSSLLQISRVSVKPFSLGVTTHVAAVPSHIWWWYLLSAFWGFSALYSFWLLLALPKSSWSKNQLYPDGFKELEHTANMNELYLKQNQSALFLTKETDWGRKLGCFSSVKKISHQSYLSWFPSSPFVSVMHLH